MHNGGQWPTFPHKAGGPGGRTEAELPPLREAVVRAILREWGASPPMARVGWTCGGSVQPAKFGNFNVKLLSCKSVC